MSITPHDNLEKQHIDNTVAWINSGEQIFRIRKPDIPNKHLVAYFVMLDKDKEKILLVDHKKAELWLPAGGHVELNEDPYKTVIRECMEELYITPEFLLKQPFFLTQAVTVGKTAGHTDVSLWYIILGDSNLQYNYNHKEFLTINWFTLDNIPYEKSDPHMKRFVHKLKNTLKK